MPGPTGVKLCQVRQARADSRVARPKGGGEPKKEPAAEIYRGVFGAFQRRRDEIPQRRPGADGEFPYKRRGRARHERVRP
jgi:hypothetical protein